MESDQEELSSKPHLVIVGGGWGVRLRTPFPISLQYADSSI